MLSLGFTFDDTAAAKGKASPVAEMHRLIAKDPRNAERIFPYLGGEEVNNDPRHAHRRWCIDFNDFPLRREQMTKTWAAMDERGRAKCRSFGVVPEDYPEPVAADWPDLLAIIERLVKPGRATDKRDAYRKQWWLFAEKRPALRLAIACLDRVIVAPRVTQHPNFVLVSAGTVFNEKTIVITSDLICLLALLSSRVSESWIRFFTSTMKDDLSGELHAVGAAYDNHRAALMVVRNEGLTKTYNRLHDPAERAPDIQRLRDLHHDMDVAVLHAYGWDDLADRAAPEFLTEATELDHRYQGRLFWPAQFRDEVLARLLELNAKRAAEERAVGVAPARSPGDNEVEDA